MTAHEINKFGGILEAMATEFRRSARRRDAIAIERSADALDRVLRAGERELAVRQLETEYARLREAQAALRRIQEGTYGICLECEENIGRKRLTALPSAALCIRCQEAMDCGSGAENDWPTLAMAA